MVESARKLRATPVTGEKFPDLISQFILKQEGSLWRNTHILKRCLCGTKSWESSIADEAKHPFRDEMRLNELKRKKLRVKEQIQELRAELEVA